MIYLKEVDLTEIEIQKQKVEEAEAKLEKEREKLRNILATSVLDYFGMSPYCYYSSLKKDYITEDGYSVQIKDGYITVVKKVKDNLTMTFYTEIDRYSYIDVWFKYDSGRYIESPVAKNKMMKKYESEVIRMNKLLETERVYNPFEDFRSYYASMDFHETI